MDAITDTFAVRLQLAERIAGLPNILTVEDTSSTVPWSVNVYLQPEVVSIRKQRPAVLLCTFTRDSIRLHSFNGRDGVLLDMPENPVELDSCWEAIQQAHAGLLVRASATRPERTPARAGRLPSFSRTTLQ